MKINALSLTSVNASTLILRIKEKKKNLDLASIRYNTGMTKEFDFDFVSKSSETMKLVTPMMSTKICSGVAMVKFFFQSIHEIKILTLFS